MKLDKPAIGKRESSRFRPGTKTIEQCLGDRDNNFNLIRIVAAYSVLVSHSFALATGNARLEPLVATVGTSLGGLAVDVFFLTSGFLVTASLLNRRDIVGFIVSRFLRIVPALLAMLIITVFILGPAVSVLGPSAYLHEHEVYRYFAKGVILFKGVDYHLPGIFPDNPWPRSINGSLWTLPYEVRMYAWLAVFWIAAGLLFRRLALAAFSLLATALVVAGLSSVLFAIDPSPLVNIHLVRLGLMFFIGTLFFLMRARIRLSPTCGVLLATLIVVSAVNPTSFRWCYILAMPYVLFCAAYLPRGFIRRFNRVGDYSYGTYIYAFPVQQSVIHWFALGPLSTIAVASPITLCLAAASWHLVEKPALAVKHRMTTTRRAAVS